LRSQHFFAAYFLLIIKSLTVLTLLSACANESSYVEESAPEESAIIGGKAATATDPWTASTVAIVTTKNSPFKQDCTGTLISSDLVLTAAHCLEGMKNTNVYVHFGYQLPKTFSFDKLQTVAGMVSNDRQDVDIYEYPRTQLNDIAIVRLKQKAPAGFAPVKINISTPIKTGDLLLLAGFGKINDEEKEKTQFLYSANAPVAKLWQSLIVLDQTAKSGACKGDSGGPAYLETEKGLVIAGITRGAYNNSPNCHGWVEFTNTAYFKDFILNATKELGGDSPKFVE